MVNKITHFLERIGFKDVNHRLSTLSNTRDIDNIVVTSDLDEDLFKEFEDTIHSHHSNNEMLNIYADPVYSDMIEDSNKIHEDVVNFFRYEKGAPTTQIVDLLSETQGDRTLLVASKDYVDQFRNDVYSQLENYEDEFISIYK